MAHGPAARSHPLSFRERPHRARRAVGRMVALALVVSVGLPVLIGTASWPAVAEDPAGGDAALAGTVVDPDGDPVAGAVVSVLQLQYDAGYYAFRTPEVVASATTAGDGVYAFPDLTDDDYGLVVSPAPGDPALLASANRQTFAGVDHPTVEDFQLSVSTVRGTVTRSDGSAASGALVVAGEIWAETVALTAEDGSYRLAPEPGQAKVLALPPVVNPALDVAAHSQVSAPDAGVVTGLDLQLGQPNLRGMVYAPDGTTGIAGALVRLMDLTTDSPVNNSRMASRSDGSFGFAVPPGRYRLEVAPPDEDIDLVARTQGEPFDVTAADTAASPRVQAVTMLGTTLAGVVRDPSGDPVPRALVYLYHRGTRDLVFSRADDTGHYGFRVPTGTVEVSLYQPRPTLAYVETEHIFDLTEVPTFRDLAFRAPNVLGRVVDQSGLPVPGTTVTVAGATTGPSDVTYAQTNHDGAFVMLLTPGTHRLVARPADDHPTGVRTAQSLEVAAAGTTETEIVLDPPTVPAYELMRLPAELDGQPAYEVDRPAVSGDGAVVAVRAEDEFMGCDCGERSAVPSGAATDPPGPDEYDEGLVLYDVPTGAQELLTTPSGVTVRPNPRLALDHDGSRVAFVSNQPDLADGTWNERAYVIDRDTGTMTTIEPPPPVSEDYRDPYYDDTWAPAISGDGRTVALVVVHEDAEWTRRHSLEVVTLDESGGVASRRLIERRTEIDPRAAISRDGSTLAFLDFVEGAWALRVMDLATGEEAATRPVFPAANEWDENYAGPSLSADGRVVAYPYDRFRIGEYGYNEQLGGVKVWDRDAGTDQQVPLFAADGGPGGDGVRQISLSADGRELVVVSAGPFPEDDTDQVWAVDLGTEAATLVSADGRGQPGRNGVNDAAVPGIPSLIAFATNSPNLTGNTDEESWQQQVMLALGEAVPPEWPDDAALTTAEGDTGSTSVRVRWTEATDNVAVSRYVVYLDGEPAGTTSADTRVLRLNGLQPDTEYDVTVQALDSRGSESTDGPSLTVRTLPSDSVELRPLDGSVAAGGTVSLSWEAPTGADEVLVRRHVGDTVVDVQSLAAGASSTQQRGLAADTAYGFQVFVRTGDQVRPFTERIELRTRALTFESLVWQPTMTGGLAQRGLVVPITATADPGRAVTVAVDYLSWYDDAHELLDEPAAQAAQVTLTEDPGQPGTYRGGFELVDGIAEVTRMSGTVSDGAGHLLGRAATRGPVGVSSDLNVLVDAPPGALAGGWVQATGPDWYGQPIGDDSVVPFPNAAEGSYQVRVYDSYGDLMGSLDGVRVRPGLMTQVSVRPQLPASLELTVRDGAGDPVTDGRVELRDHTTGEWLGQQYLGSGGGAVMTRLQEGQIVDLALDFPPDSLLRDRQQQVTLEPGTNRVEITAQSVGRARLSGLVSYEDGAPVEGATVRLLQTHDGVSHTFTDQTGEDGRYDVLGLADHGQVSVTAGVLSHRQDVDLTDGDLTRDVTLHGPRMYTLRLRLFTRSPGATAEVGPIALDWRTAVHYGMTLNIEGRHQWYSSSTVADDGSTLVTVNGAPGDRLDWCIDGREPRLAPTCTRGTLGEARSLTLEMHAGAVTEVLGRAVDDAAVVSYFRGDLYRLDETGRTLVSSRNHYGQVREVAQPGDYELVLSAGDLSGRTSFTVDSDQVGIDLGDIELDRAVRFAGAGNEVQSARRQALPGTAVEMRATWRNTAAGAATDTVARIAVPAGTSLVADSVLLDGQPVTPAAGDGFADVEVGTVDPGANGVLLYRLRLADDATGLVPGAVEMRYGAGPTREQLAPATIRVTGLTIAGPATITSDRLPLSGRAPAGSVVEIVHGSALLGQAVATPGGLWSQTVTLPLQQRSDPLHRVVAQTTLDAQRLTAEHQVVVDDRRPVATSVSMYQVDGEFPNGRTFTFDPRDGVARFPFVFVPNQPLVVDVTFDHPELVTSADVHIGSLTVSTTRLSDGRFRARTTPYSVDGPVRLSYDAAARPVDMTEPELSDQEIRDQAPAPLQGFGVSDAVQPDPAAAGPKVGAFTSSVPSVAGGSVRATLTVSRETYTTTDRDMSSQASSGSSVYGLSWNRSGSTLSFSFVVPLSELPGAERTALQGMLQRSGVATAPRAAGAAVGVARVGYELAFNGVTTLDSLLSAVGAGEKYQKLADAVDAASGCSPATANAYAQRAQNIALAAAAGDVGGALFSVGALVFGPATFGLGTVALGVLGWALDKAVGYAIDQAIETLMNDIGADEECEDEEDDDDEDDDDRDDDDRDDDDRDDLADPTWIYDPSGYTFEGARSARIGGVTATLLTAPTADGPWAAWDADWFGQVNPQTTDAEGRYGWDVPEGWWKVAYTKDGYLPAYSRVLRVLPPHLDVDVSMTKEGFPHVTSAALRDGGVEVEFDRMVRSASLDALRVEDSGGNAVPGSWSAIGSANPEDGPALQRGARFTPTGGFSPGTELTVTVERVTDYSGRPMTEPYVLALSVPDSPGGGGGPTDPPVGTEAPAAPSGVTAEAGERRATVTWTAPDDGGSEITSSVVTVVQTGRQVVVDDDATQVEVGALVPGTSYTFTVTARNDVGTGPASQPSNAVVPTAVAPETTMTAGPEHGGVVTTRRATLGWTSSGPPAASWRCTLDGRTSTCSTTSLALRGLASGTHTFTVAAVDEDGDVDPTPAVRTWTVPRDDRKLDPVGAWRTRNNHRAFDEAYLQTRHRGAGLVARVADATGLALVVGRGPHHGHVTVWLGRRRLGSVDLSSRTVEHARVVDVATFSGPRSGRVRIEVRSRGKVVRVDGLAVLTE